jgi:molecular chaperone DnaK (HSP70)
MNVGIDLGSSTTIASSLDDYGIVKSIPDVHFRESLFTPSCVYIEDNKALVGRLAEIFTENNPQKKDIRFFKRMFGKQAAVFTDDRGNSWLPETVGALVLKKVKHDAETVGMGKIASAVVSVPAHFNDVQRRAIIDAGRLAGLPVSGIIEEPVAAALSYYHKNESAEEVLMVYDFGGGTFDVSVIAKSGSSVHVISKDGINNIGGYEFDQVIFEDILKLMQRNWNINPDFIGETWKQSIRNHAEKIKIRAGADRAQQQHSFWIQHEEELFEYIFRPEWFRSQVDVYLQKTEALIHRNLKSMNLASETLDRVLLIGGSSQFPFVSEFLARLFPQLKNKICTHNPVYSVSHGASIYAASTGTSGSVKTPLELRGVATYTIAIEDNSSKFDKLIFRNTPLPAQVRRNFPMSHCANGLRVRLVQFWDEKDEIFEVGNIIINPQSLAGESQGVELVFEFRPNGTTGIKAFGAGSRRELPIAIKKDKPKIEFDFDAQKKLVDSVVVNSIPF